MGNRVRGVYDSGAVAHGQQEADIALHWANGLRQILRERGYRVIRTRVDEKDPCPVSRRDDIAVAYGGDLMLSLHCNSGRESASGTEVFYRGSEDAEMANDLSVAVSTALGLRNRGAKTEKESQHKSLAVLDFPACWLIEIGFLSNYQDIQKMIDPDRQTRAYHAIADVIDSYFKKAKA